MSRTYKDKPYRLVEQEAIEHGYWELWPDWRGGYRIVGDTYAYRNATGKRYRTYSRWHDYRDYEAEWNPDYGDPKRIRMILRQAADAHNHGIMDEDWDDSTVYQRRRAWIDR